MDEIADHNGRVALLVGKFGLDNWLSGEMVQTMLVKATENNPDGCTPKNPSPARLRRVWETCQQFWAETVEQNILGKLPKRTRWELVPTQPLGTTPPQGIALDGTLNGQPISVFRLGNHILTISFVVQPQKGVLSITWEEDGRKRRVEMTIVPQDIGQDELVTYQSYTPSLTLLTSPDQFLALVPASDALEVVAKIRQDYQTQLSKAQNRLPLFLGLIFFQSKMPLTAVMDTARRMLETNLCSEEWIVEEKEPTGTGQWPPEVKVRLEKDGMKLCFNVKTVMGDNQTKDVWYPYWHVKGNFTGRMYYFTTNNDEHWVHINDLHKGDHVSVTPSRFSYVFLQSTAQRFRFDPAKDVMLLDDMQSLRKMWEDLQKPGDMTQTKLRAIWSLFQAKWDLWGLNDEHAPDYSARREAFKQLVETTFKRDKIQGITPDQVLNGLFDRCLELHLHILKLKVEQRRNKEESNE